MTEEHDVDFAVSCSPFGRFDAIPLRRDRIAAMLPGEYPGLSAVDLNAPPDLLIINRPAYDTIQEQLRRPLPSEQILLVQTAETAVQMVLDGVGIGILSEYTMDTLAAGYQKYPVAPEISFDIGVFANDIHDMTPAAQEFLNRIPLVFSSEYAG